MTGTTSWQPTGGRATSEGRGVLVTLAGAVLCAQVVYLLTLLVAAAVRRRNVIPLSWGATSLRFLILVPAHDEVTGLSTTLSSLAVLDISADARQVVVIADNCSDGTAAVARHAGVRVLERHEPARRGKGHAIAWALECLAAEGTSFDVVVVVDADCTVSSNMLQAIGARMRNGAEAVQVSYEVANPAASRASGLRYAGYALMNTVRPMGKAAFGLSAGLYGSGMAFTSGLLQRVPWTAASIVEDHEHHLRLVASGTNVAFAPEANVRSAMPTTFRRSTDQQLRWESGRLRLAVNWAPRLMSEGLRRRDRQRLHAGFELLMPPQSLLLLGNVAVAAWAAARKRRTARCLAMVGLAGQGIYVLGGLAVVGAPVEVYRSLAAAPVLVGQKLVLALRIACGRGPTDFVRTQRDGES